MGFKRISPEEARDLVDREGYVYLDVRSVPEFEAGHPKGAYNVPLLHMGPAGMAPNPDFLGVVQKAFPKDARLVVGCKMGGRSMKAAQALVEAGYTSVVDQRAGFDGGPAEPGWRPKGLPVSRAAEPGRDYESLQSKASCPCGSSSRAAPGPSAPRSSARWSREGPARQSRGARRRPSRS